MRYRIPAFSNEPLPVLDGEQVAEKPLSRAIVVDRKQW
jgi:hypothetical protein